jgi:copper resistance protein B
MTRLILALLASSAATPALAQHGGHQPAPPPPPPATCTAEHAAMGHCTMPRPAPPPPAACTAEHAAMGHCTMPRPAPPPPATCTAEHAAMGHCTMARPAPPPPASCTAEHAAMGHCTMPPTGADPNAGHEAHGDAHAGHGAEANGAIPPAPPVGPPPAEALSGPAHAADLVFGAAQMQPSRRELIRTHGRMATSRLRFERLELGVGDAGESYGWEGDFFYGGPLDRLWLKTEGEGAFGEALEHGEVQALWGHAIAPFFDLQAGLRYDFAPDPERAHAVIGVQGLAPYWIEVEAAAFLSDQGEVTARIEAEHDLRITQRLVLQPLLEVELSAQDSPELGIGAGVVTTETALRLRYEITPELAPYLGVEWEQAYGATADLREAVGEDASALRLLAGLRIWF